MNVFSCSICFESNGILFVFRCLFVSWGTNKRPASINKNTHFHIQMIQLPNGKKPNIPFQESTSFDESVFRWSVYNLLHDKWLDIEIVGIWTKHEQRNQLYLLEKFIENHFLVGILLCERIAKMTKRFQLMRLSICKHFNRTTSVNCDKIQTDKIIIINEHWHN